MGNPIAFFDTIVVGLGAVGSAACYVAAKMGKVLLICTHDSQQLAINHHQRVLGLEMQASAPHALGSSHGESRIIRLTYHEHPEYIPLLKEAYRMWHTLEQEQGCTLLTQTGYLDISPPSDQCGHGQYSICDRSTASAQRYGLEHEVLDAAQTMQRFPALRLPPHFKVCLSFYAVVHTCPQACYQPDGGILDPEACMAAHLQQAQAAGATLLFGHRVTAWQATDDTVEVTASHAGSLLSFRAATLILTAGPWIGQLVPPLKVLCLPLQPGTNHRLA